MTPNGKPSTKWTVMVYMAADTGESFYRKAMEDITEMTAAEFEPDQIRVVVYADAPCPWVAKRWEIRRGQATLLQCGRNMSLVPFFEGFAQQYPADYYLVVLWGHGEGIDWKEKILGPPRGKRFGQGSQSALEVGELANTLRDVEFQKFLRIPRENIVLGFDACLMSMVEVYYQIQNHVRWVVAANDEIPDTGWPYEKILNRLRDGPAPADLAAGIVEDCTDWYSKKTNKSNVSFSACDLDKIGPLVEKAVKDLTASLEKHFVSGLPAIRKARDFAEDYQERAYVDLNAFCAQLKRIASDRLKQKQPLEDQERDALEELGKAAQSVLQRLNVGPNEFVIAGRFSDEYPHKYTVDARAVSICFPESEELEGSLAGLKIDWGSYETLLFSVATGWDRLMRKFWAQPRVA